ncbi:MAG: hypothetical protein K6T83_20430 [Alicyclobacillus sp.]|nr:hypothetical protein [Alicyclobacillus sp.]
MTDILTQAQKLLELSEIATSGPWSHEKYSFGSWVNGPAYPFNSGLSDDAAFIVHARNHAPDIARTLLEAVEVLERVLHVCVHEGELETIGGNPLDLIEDDARDFLKRVGVTSNDPAHQGMDTR